MERLTSKELKVQLANEVDESRRMQARLKGLEAQVSALAAAVPVVSSMATPNMAPTSAPDLSQALSSRLRGDTCDTSYTVDTQVAFADAGIAALEQRLRLRRASEENAISNRISSKLLGSLRDMHREL